MTRRSLNEIRTTVQKAAVGAGLPPGIAEDVGRAAAWLSARGLDGVGAALLGIKTPSDDTSGVPKSRAVGEAISALDRVAVSEAETTIEQPDLDAPLLFLGLAANVAADYGLGFEIEFGGGATAMCSPRGTRLPDDLPESGCTIVITVKPDSRCSNDPVPTTDGVAVNDAAWTETTALAARTYVPSTEESRRAGAGAGLTDND